MNLSFRRIAASLALAGLTGMSAAACSSGPTDSTGVGEAPAPAAQKVDASRVASLPAGETLVLDVSHPDVAYDIDYSAAPIDFSRIKLHIAEGRDVAMTDWLAQTASGGRDIVSQNPKHFVIRPLSSSELSPELIDPVSPGQCVTFCMWVCETEQGPCTYKCITNCP
jgi:hypothetical protein